MNPYFWRKNMGLHFIFDKEYRQHTFTSAEIRETEFENCTFIECDFTACFFQAVTFSDCNFVECNFKNTKINHVSLRGVWFNHCDFTSVNFAMTDQVIYEFHFKDCLLDYAQFYKLKLKKIQFINCSMVSVDFMASDLSESLFDNCNLRLAVFSETIMNKADLYTSYNFSIDPEKNKLKRAIFSAQNLKGLLDKYQLIIKE